MLKISQGSIYDPANGRDGEIADLWIDAGRIVAAPSDPRVRPTRTIDARGLVVMPGGVDMHSHIVGPKVNAARRLRPEDKEEAERIVRRDGFRSGLAGSVPTTFATGYKYAALGYTAVFDAAVAPLGARQAHAEFADTPCIDAGCFLLMGNNALLMEALARNDRALARAFIGWVLTAARGYAPKLVNPGGVEVWKQSGGGARQGLDEPVPPYGVTPRQIVREVAAAAADLGLPHPVHIHCNQLGMPGNWTTTLETMRALEGRRGHLTHIQFHSYGGGDGEEATLCSRTAALADVVNASPNLTVDVGQVLFGSTTSMTGDGPLGHFLARLSGRKWYSHDLECEGGCGVSPIEYKQKSLVHALQWAIGLEWYLLVNDPWQVAMSTDHPNGGSFLAYPQIIHLLMDAQYRRDVLRGCPPALRQRTVLADLDRQYTLGEIAVITRAGPARMLGLTRKGHLGPGADADVTLYDRSDDIRRMFELPRCVIKGGVVVAEQGELRAAPDGRTLRVRPDYDREAEPTIEAWFNDHYSMRWRNFPVDLPPARDL